MPTEEAIDMALETYERTEELDSFRRAIKKIQTAIHPNDFIFHLIKSIDKKPEEVSRAVIETLITEILNDSKHVEPGMLKISHFLKILYRTKIDDFSDEALIGITQLFLLFTKKINQPSRGEDLRAMSASFSLVALSTIMKSNPHIFDLPEALTHITNGNPIALLQALISNYRAKPIDISQSFAAVVRMHDYRFPIVSELHPAFVRSIFKNFNEYHSELIDCQRIAWALVKCIDYQHHLIDDIGTDSFKRFFKYSTTLATTADISRHTLENITTLYWAAARLSSAANCRLYPKKYITRLHAILKSNIASLERLCNKNQHQLMTAQLYFRKYKAMDLPKIKLTPHEKPPRPTSVQGDVTSFLHRHGIAHTVEHTIQHCLMVDIHVPQPRGKGIVIEIDGPIHGDKTGIDWFKDRLLKRLGYTVHRITHRAFDEARHTGATHPLFDYFSHHLPRLFPVAEPVRRDRIAGSCNSRKRKGFPGTDTNNSTKRAKPEERTSVFTSAAAPSGHATSPEHSSKSAKP